MAYEDDLTALNNSLQTAINYQNSQQSLKLAEDDLEFGKEAFSQQMALANQQFDWNKRVANRNYEWQKTQWEYQKQLNQLAMEREDNAFQRARADLEKAGLSPLMLSTGAGAQALNAGVAPQYDVSGVNTSYGAKQDALERRRQQINENRQYRFQQKQANRQLALQSASMALQVEKQTQELVSSIYENRQKKQQTERLEHENEFYRKHGYRPVTLATVLSDFLNREETRKSLESLGSLGDKIQAGIKDGLSKFAKVGTDAPIYNNTYNFYEDIGLTKQQESVLNQALKENGFDPSKADIVDLLNPKVMKRVKELEKAGK